MRVCDLCKNKIFDTLFRVPSNDAERNKWSAICGVRFTPKARICSRHFLASNIINVGRRKTLLQGAVPYVVQWDHCLGQSINEEFSMIGAQCVDYAPETFEHPENDPWLLDDSRNMGEISMTSVQSVDSTAEIGRGTEMDSFLLDSSINLNNENAKNEHCLDQSINEEFSMIGAQCVDYAPETFAHPENDPWLLDGSRNMGEISMTSVQSVDSTAEIGVGTETDFFLLDSSINLNNENVKNERANYEEQQTQTDLSIFGVAAEYFQRIQALEAENVTLKNQLSEANAAINAMRTIFTEGQIRKIMSPGRIRWKWKDISNAICLHAAGPRAYNHLYKKGFPLPHTSTLQRWCGKIHLSEGILSSSIEFMHHTNDLAFEDKICVLVFDEMKVAETYEYDPVVDIVKKPVNYVQVIMARGLKKAWKQPIFYDFDCKVTKDLLFAIIRKLYNAGFPVVATVCDMGPCNRKLWRDLGVTTDKPWFQSPVYEDEKIFTFADAPHLLKLIRNHFLDDGIIFESSLLSSRTIVDLLAHTSKSDISIAFKLSNEHLSVKGTGRQKVKLAAQLFSNTTANAIRRCHSLGMQLYSPIETADFFQLINDWFDVLNSKLSTFKYPGKEPYGLALERQDEVLRKMNALMSCSILPGHKNVGPFQKGILMTNTALMMLRSYVERFNMTYLVTNRLNQDVLEHFFGAIRSKGGLNDHPSPRDFKYRLRKYILARNTELLEGRGNVENDQTDWLNSAEPQFPTEEGTIVEDETELSQVLPPEPNEESEFDDFTATNLEDIGILQEDALEYISGYIIKKLKLEEYEGEIDSFSWVSQTSKGYLKKPTSDFLAKLKELELVFSEINGKHISHAQNLQKNLVERSNLVDLPEKIKTFFFKCRIYFRVRHLNKQLKSKKSLQRIMGLKKMLTTIK